VIALPLGVLQQPPDAPAGVRFEPELPTRSLLQDRLCMGQVIKITLQCRTPFWETLGDCDLSFVHAMKAPIPVWWTTHPLRTHRLTGWIGGTRAENHSANRDDVMRDAVASLASIFHVSRRRIASEILEAHLHDWRSDPFSRGAYSYLAVGGADAPATLARPIQQTLYFAGEHTHTGMIGTVAGAIQSGYRAAAQVQRSTGRTKHDRDRV
jgi:monoamine oxidase